MGDIARAIVLGIVQGLTEFLPISSSGHLALIPWLFGWESFGLAFDVALHLGTLGAVASYFRRELWQIAVGVLRGLGDLPRGRLPVDPMGRLGIFIAAGSIPAALAGALFNDTINAAFYASDASNAAIATIAVLVIGFGLLLGYADRRASRDPDARRDIVQVGLADALWVGAAQMLALVPGVSRSGATITAGFLRGLDRPTAARFSFVFGVPAVLGASALELGGLLRDGIPAGQGGVFAAGMLSSLIVGYLAIAGLLQFLQRRSTNVFVAYRVALGAGVLLLLAAGFRN